MDRLDFDYMLPEALIAQAPLPQRSASRLLVMARRAGPFKDRLFMDLPGLLEPGDLLVFNNTRVIPARLHGRKASGGQAEILIERIVGSRTAFAQVRASRSPRAGSSIVLAGGGSARVEGREGPLFKLIFDRDIGPLLERQGQVPLPPYIDRQPMASDIERYQTVYAEVAGAVAAPTAGLHFDQAVLDALAERGINSGFVTLHVGAGTFAPLRSDPVETQRLHHEWLEVNDSLCDQVRRTRLAGGRVYGVGTTSVRALETAARSGTLLPYRGDTDLFIYPGFTFQAVDGIVTNFHLPQSSLLMLVAAFAGRERTLAAYEHAVQARYRFFSYGDAMLITPESGR
jgi:S-adenosylmethionine:tRNA ribosyltransferase-isomerase